ncbi:TIGR00730 family Rossman fold protein [Methyloglobulus sp.]|uniref:LOG family protein n=1 Tax=Methyloglobulus sp. TaxID=2518622 RepID=UPI0032B84035
MPTINSLCIYCGSSPGRSGLYASSAISLAKALVSRNITLVYGGASIGIMGILADNVLKLGGQAIGVIPKALAHKEVAHQNLTELHITQSMHERKMLMAELADGFIALPGGIGTLEELFEIWTWAQLGFHNKPCGLLNIYGYYDLLIGFLGHALEEQFVKKHHHALLMVEQTLDLLIERFANYRPPAATHWVGKNET